MKTKMLNNTPYTPSNIGEIKFRVPLYQRPYAWGREQVQQLLEDLYEAFCAGSDQNYFIGIMSVCKTDSDPNRFDLIDGQQRITTLMLIGKALKDKYKDIYTCWDNFMQDRLELYGREEDSKYLQSFSSTPNEKMVVAVETTTNFFEDNKSDTDNFAKYIYEHTAFFLSEIPNGYSLIDKNNHFVRMNHRGKQLEQADILKVKLGSILEDDKQSAFFKAWNKWSQLGCGEEKEQSEEKEPKDAKTVDSIEEIIKKTNASNTPPERSNNYESIVSFPEFLLIALDRFLEQEEKQNEQQNTHHIKYQKDKLLSNFGFCRSDTNVQYGVVNDYWKPKEVGKEKVGKFQEFVDKQYTLLIDNFIRKDKTEKYTWFSIKNEDETNEDMNAKRDSIEWQKLKMFQSYLYVTYEPHKWMKQAFDWLNKQELSPEGFLAKLKCIDNGIHKKTDLSNEPKEPKEYKFKAVGNYWFRRLDYYLWEEICFGSGQLNKEFYTDKCKEIIRGKFFFRNNSPSVEHLHPRDESQCNDKWNDSDKIGCFGNLALISQGLNSYQSNKSVDEKLGKLKDIIQSPNGVLDSVKLYLMYEIASGGQWTPELANKHGKEMIEFLKNTYPKDSSEAE